MSIKNNRSGESAKENTDNNVFKVYDFSFARIQQTNYHRARFFPNHTHELPFFSLLLKGNYFESYGRRHFIHEPMSFWWRRAGIVRRGEVKTAGATLFSAEIKASCLDLVKQHTPVPEDFAVQNTKLNSLALHLYKEFKNLKEPCSALIMEGLTLEILGYSGRRKRHLEKKPPRWLIQIKERLKDDFLSNPTTEELALQANVHPVYLTRVFRKFFNQTIGEYIQKSRVKYASELLFDEDLPLVEIAILTGFSDQSHFTRIFKRYTGFTPGKFRQKLT